MRAIGWWVAGAVILAGCASSQNRKDGTAAQATEAAPSEDERALRFVDSSLGFEIRRPNAGWRFDAGAEAPPGLVMPVVVSHDESGAQVVVQVAPDVAPAGEFAERLAIGLRSKPGFSTSVPAENGKGVTSFQFALGDEVLGQVNVRGARDRMFVVLATWPAETPAAVVGEIEGIMNSLHPLEETALIGCPPATCLKL